MKRRFNDRAEARICASYKRHGSVTKVARARGVPRQTVQSILIRHEIFSNDAAIRATDWTPVQVATLRQLWAEGKSATQIANTIGGKYTRMAIIGKANRLRLPARIPGQPYHLRKIAA